MLIMLPIIYLIHIMYSTTIKFPNRVVNLPYSSQHFTCMREGVTRVVEQAFACCRLMLSTLFEIILRLVPCIIVILGERYN